MKKRRARPARRAAKLPAGPKLDHNVNAAELPLLLRTAKLGAIANRSEKLAANEASMLRNAQRRNKQIIDGRANDHHPSIESASVEVQQELNDLAKAAHTNWA